MKDHRQVRISWVILPMFIIGMMILAFHHHGDGAIHENCHICHAVAYSNALPAIHLPDQQLQTHSEEVFLNHASLYLSLALATERQRSPPVKVL